MRLKIKWTPLSTATHGVHTHPGVHFYFTTAMGEVKQLKLVLGYTSTALIKKYFVAFA